MAAAHCSFCQEDQGSVHGGAAHALGDFFAGQQLLRATRVSCASSLAVELRKARLMYVPHLVCVEQSLLAAVLQSSPEDPWVNALEVDLEDMKARSAEKLSVLPPFSQDPQPWCNLWRSFPGPWKEPVRLVYKGVVECGTVQAPVPEEEVQCPQCEKWFGGGELYGLIRSGRRDQLRRFVLSAECPACSKVIPSRARALHHARYSSRSCQQRLLNEEFPMATESELERLDIEMAQFRATCRGEGVSHLAASE